MTYLAPRMVQRYVRRPMRPSLSGWLDDIVADLNPQPSQSSQCIDQANAAVAALDARTNDLAKNWAPTGFYTTADIRSLVSSTMAVVQQGYAALNQAATSANASQDSITRATDDLARAGGRSLDYLQAAQTADQQNLRTVNAPGLKTWVTNTMGAASSAMVTASTISCMEPWWLGAMATAQAAFDALWSVAKQVVGAVLAIGETALKVANDLPELYDTLKYVALAAGAYWLWINYVERRP